jgi:NADPH:quinone reductase
VPPWSVRPVPDGVAPAEAAAFGVVYETAFYCLTSVAGLAAGERLCVLGAAGGVGLAAVDLSAEGLRDRLREVGGVDVVLDMVGGEVSEQALRALRPGGRFVTVGYASGVIPKIPLNLVLVKDISITGFQMRTFLERFPDQAADGWRVLAAHLAAGQPVSIQWRVHY